MTPELLIATIAALVICFIAGAIVTWCAITDKRDTRIIEEAHARNWGRG
jgi:hypothetical protein